MTYTHGHYSECIILECFGAGATVEGPSDTPYEGGLFVFDICLPADYPQQAPKAHYWAWGKYINPNLYACGKVCLSLLGTWAGPVSPAHWQVRPLRGHGRLSAMLVTVSLQFAYSRERIIPGLEKCER